MLIESKFHRPKSPVTFGRGQAATSYYFTPVDPENPKSAHVAEVTVAQHIEDLLAVEACPLPDGTKGRPYRIYQAGATRALPAAQKEEAASPFSETASEISDSVTTASDVPEGVDFERAQAIKDSSIVDLRAILPATEDKALLELALKLERECGTPRISAITLIQSRINALS